MILTFCNINGMGEIDTCYVGRLLTTSWWEQVSRLAKLSTQIRDLSPIGPRQETTANHGYGFILNRVVINSGRGRIFCKLIAGITHIFYQVAAIGGGGGQFVATVVPFVRGMAFYPYEFYIVLFM